jgi:NAD(P)-dependent dehydrogenase (short-subunit alcohol dehydrogenase family)
MLTAARDVPPNHFGKKSTAMQVTEGIDLSGKTVLLTGCTSGIGLETMKALAFHGAHVLAVGRTQAKAAAAWGSVRTSIMKGVVTPLGCEHEDLASVVALADTVNAMNTPIDILICNAGIVGAPKLEQINGIEKQFVVNHLSHFVLINRLLDAVKKAPQGRVVIVSSEAHRTPGVTIEFDNLSGERKFSALRTYGQSKLANLLTARELAKRTDGTSVTVNALHPGVVYTNIFKNLPPLLNKPLYAIGKLFMKSPEAGAATTCYVATSPDLAKVRGVYFDNCKPKEPTPDGQSDALAAKLWAVSEDLTRAYL